MCLLSQLLKSLQEFHVSVKENNHFSVVRAHMAGTQDGKTVCRIKG